MAAPDSSVELTTALALEEKSKLKKSLRRVDMLLFTICAMVGVDTLGQVSSFGAESRVHLLNGLGHNPRGRTAPES